jgi:hypothetical protein
MKRAAAIAVLALALPTLAHAESQTWKITADVGGQPVHVSCVLEAAGGKLAGPCTSDLSPEQAKASGAYTATTSELAYDINGPGGQTMHIVYKGEAQPDGSMKGTVDVGGMAGTFTASR